MSSKKTCSGDDDYDVGVRRALAAIIASTRRVRRKDDLVSIAKNIETAREGLGSYAAVARAVPDLSAEMVRQFASVRKLCEPVKQLIRERKIESVDVAHRLSKLAPSDQAYVAKAYVSGRLDSDDVRAVVSLRKSMRAAAISRVVKRVVESRDIKEYTARFRVPGIVQGAAGLRRRLAAVVGNANIKEFGVDGNVVSLVLSAKGRNRLQTAARANQMTKREVLEAAGAGRTAAR